MALERVPGLPTDERMALREFSDQEEVYPSVAIGAGLITPPPADVVPQRGTEAAGRSGVGGPRGHETACGVDLRLHRRGGGGVVRQGTVR